MNALVSTVLLVHLGTLSPKDYILIKDSLDEIRTAIEIANFPQPHNLSNLDNGEIEDEPLTDDVDVLMEDDYTFNAEEYDPKFRGRTKKKVIVKIRRMWLKEKTYNLFYNFSRIISGHQPLIQGFRLNKAAWQHAKDMAERQQCDHVGFKKRSEKFNFDAENASAGQKTIFGALFGWIGSEDHRKNMYSYGHLFYGTGFAKRVEKIYMMNDRGKMKRVKKTKSKYYVQVFR